MKERINWIDWGKTIAVFVIVFSHLPQSREWFYFCYVQAITVVVFFFLSGYLKKDRGSNRANWQKYWHGLIIPYLLYNAIVYPYWFLKYYLTNGSLPSLFEALRPIFSALLLEHENAFCEPLNGPLWYLPVILIMHIIIDLCRKTRYQHTIMISLCIVSFFLYAANKYWYFAPDLTPMGLIRNLPYYYIGYLFGLRKLFRDVAPKRDAICCILCLGASILFFAWHMQTYYAGLHLLHIALFYPVNIGFLFGVLYGCKVLDKYKSDIIVNFSIGTLVIIGLHIVLVTIANFTIEHLLGINNICYHWYTALPVALLITALLYPVILLAKRHIPSLIGRKQRIYLEN